MLNGKLIFLLVIFHIFPPGNKAGSQSKSFSVNLVSSAQSSSSRSVGKKYKTVETSSEDLKCNYNCTTTNEPAPTFVGRTQARFTDQGTNDTVNTSEMEAPVGKFSIFNLLPVDEDEEDKDDDDDLLGDDGDDDDDDDESVKNEEEGDSDDQDFNIFGLDDDIGPDQPEGTKDESLLKQYHRHRLRMHNMVFPLLLAYKLKFFTVLPLLLGSLVLLVGTTGVAGFFFALFAAALGIHVKTQEH